MIKFIDNFLNSITMYRLMVYGLMVQTVLAFIFATFGLIAFSPVEMIFSLVILLAFCEGSNILFAKVFHAVRNTESAIITALLLFFVLDPSFATLQTAWVLPAGAVIAMASKYVIAIKHRHLINPVAIAAVVLGLFGTGAAIWWVATPLLFPFVVVFGLLVTRKIRRFHVVGPFLLVAFLVALVRGQHPVTFLISWPLIFFGTMMLTEPRTAPSHKRDQIIYGVLVGILFAIPFSMGSFALTPELSLVIANILAYFVSSKQVLKLTYKSTTQCTPQVCDFVFTPDQKVSFIPGQYLEWTLPLAHADSRGNRRYFTVASSPTDAEVHLGVRLDNEHGSAFKKALSSMKDKEVLFASHATGDFILPNDVNQKLVFIAGGIGVTPFWSMIQWLAATNQKRDIVLFYAANTENDFAYKAEMEAIATAVGLKIVYIVAKPSATWTGKTGYLSKELLDETVPDYAERMFYLSGPNAMVANYHRLLLTLRLKPSKIKVDYFPGF